MSSLPDVSSCGGMESNCWSVGQADVDCPGNALCCFDGCRNACYFEGRFPLETALRVRTPSLQFAPHEVIQ